jgi:hypothetical protein
MLVLDRAKVHVERNSRTKVSRMSMESSGRATLSLNALDLIGLKAGDSLMFGIEGKQVYCFKSLKESAFLVQQNTKDQMYIKSYGLRVALVKHYANVHNIEIDKPVFRFDVVATKREPVDGFLVYELKLITAARNVKGGSRG